MRNHLQLGNWNALCDRCGRKFKASELQRTWEGLMVCAEDYETRHPSDFLRVQAEKITVPWARPYPDTDTFVAYSCSIKEMNCFADIGVADCARIDFSMPYDSWDVQTNWLYRDMYPAIAGQAQAGSSTSGIIKSLQPEI